MMISASYTVYIEIISTALALGSIYLATKENYIHWFLGLLSSALFCIIFWDSRLYVDALLNLFYCVMAIYGAYLWKIAPESDRGSPVYKVALSQLSVWIAIIAIFSAIIGSLMSAYTDAVAPYLDTFAAFSSLLGMYMLAKKIRENWLVWGIANTVYIYLYILQGLHTTALLCVCLNILCIKGYIDWTKNNDTFLNFKIIYTR